MRKFFKFITFLIILLLIFPTIIVSAENTDFQLGDYVEQLIDGLDLSSLEEFLNSISNNVSIKEVILDAIKGDYLTFNEIITLIVDLLKENYTNYFAVFLSLLSLTIVYSVFSVIKPGKGQFNDLIFTACYCGIAVVLFNETSAIIKSTKDVISGLTTQTQTIFPILLTLLASSGATASSSVYKPVCVLVSNGITSLITKILFPIVIMISLISIISSLCEKYTLKGLNDFLAQIFKWIIGLTITIFSIFISVKGITATNYDNISLRIIKYAVGSGLPIIGGIAKDGVDLVLTATVLLKNAVGSIAIFLIFFTIFRPFIKIVIFSLLLKLLSGICEPIADYRISVLFNSMSKVVTMLVSLLFMIFIVYFLTIILMISTNGVGV